nr:response regulator [Candidatus Brocadiales bacterium]
MSIPIRALIVEDSEDDTILLVRELRRNGYDVLFERVDTYKDMQSSLEKQDWDIVFCDYSMPKFDGLTALKLLHEENHELPFILVSGTIGEEVAVKAMKSGADDYIMKDNLSRLAIAVKRELKEYKDRQELNRMEETIQTLVKSTVIKTGEDSFRKIISSVREWLDTDFVCLGQIVDTDSFRGISMLIKTGDQCDCTHNIKGTLCEVVIKEGFCHYPEGAGELLPVSCEQCTNMNAEGFLGMSIQDESGKCIGVLWTVSSKKLILPPRATEVMEVITAKIGSEIKRMWAEEQLHLHNAKLETLVKERTTRIMELERQRMEYEKLAASGRMAATVAHEINNPLSSIKGAFLLIKDSIPEDNKYYDYVNMIDKEIDRIARIVKQMFNLSRPYQGEINEFDAISVIHNVLTMLNSEQCVFKTSNDHDDMVKVTMSEDHFKQVLYNIIKNAIEASHERGRVVVRIKTCNDRLNVIVSDPGEGMTEEVRSKIFEPFFTTKSKYSDSGLGLGLATTKVVVES